MFSKTGKKLNLYKIIITPMYGIITVLVSLLCFSSSMVIIRLQNSNTMSSVNQSVEYIYRDISEQFLGMESFVNTLTVNNSIASMLSRPKENITEVMEDYYDLYRSIENFSLMSVKANARSDKTEQFSYTVSVIIEEGSPFYPIANSNFLPISALYKSEAVKDYGWYTDLMQQGHNSVWWKENNTLGEYIYYAIRLRGINDLRTVGMVTCAYNMSSLKTIINAGIDIGSCEFLLTDKNMELIYGNTGNLPEGISNNDLLGKSGKKEDSFFLKYKNNKYFIEYKTFSNGWKLIAVLPENSVKRYTAEIIGIGLLSGLTCIVIAGWLARRAANRVAVPVSGLIREMKETKIDKFDENILPDDRIYEIWELHKGYYDMLLRNRKLIDEVYKAEIEKKQARLNLLQSQINPHFLYNTLDIINCKALQKDAKDISSVVLALADLFRYGLNKGRDYTTLREELKHARSYIEIQKLMQNSLNVYYDIKEDVLDLKVINLILQPLIENSIIHGFKSDTAGFHIKISAGFIDGRFIISVYDNGTGVDAHKMNAFLEDAGTDTGRGYGIINVDRRIKLYFGDVYGLKYMSVETGTCVEIYLPS